MTIKAAGMHTKISFGRLLAVLWLGAAVSVAAPSACATSYDSEVSQWTSHEDVAKWLKSNFQFDAGRQSQVQRQLKETGPENVLTRKPENLYAMKAGYCRDSASFARDALNRISPQHNAKYIFVKNRLGPPNHWVTGYQMDGKLYVMDYGAGHHWQAMEGVHGPYDSLDGYKNFLASLYVKGFQVEEVRWRDLPGAED